MLLNTFIQEASDRRLVLRIAELPELFPVARTVDEIEDVVRAAAAQHTGQHKDEFDVEVHY